MNKSIGNITANIMARSGIIIFFIVAFEIMIMISPFAFFFYSVFNPIFKWLSNYWMTRWLTVFFLPHMILPPTIFLKGIRILGSILFVVGMFTFAICALQVYFGKLFKWGIAERGLYKFIRHPQYLALGTWGVGMCILWPRFIVLASLSIMFIIYYFLAKDEENRMLNRYGESYKQYINNTGMFTPIVIDNWFSKLVPNIRFRGAVISFIVIAIVMLSGFCLREITLRSLSFYTEENITLVSLLPEDAVLNKKVADGIIKYKEMRKVDFLIENKDYMGYLMPADYIMQGMIANTGSDFHLFKKHHTLSMITEWVIHPFQHLKDSPSLHMAQMHHVNPEFARRHHCPIGINDPNLQCEVCPYRRVIFVEVDNLNGRHFIGKELLSVNISRTPICYVDINTTTGEIINIKLVEKTTAWQDVPTPAI